MAEGDIDTSGFFAVFEKLAERKRNAVVRS